MLPRLMVGHSGFDATFSARLGDFFAPAAPWNRRLWSLGLILSLEELLDVSHAVAERLVWAATFDTLKRAVADFAAADAGLGTGPIPSALQECLAEAIVPGGY